MARVAIVGLAAELPSGTYSDDNFDHHDFFDFLLNSGQSYEPIPLERFNAAGLQGRALGQVGPSHGSFLKNLDQFDYQEFGVSAKDARAMPIGVRKLIELSFLALRDSGIDYRGKNVASFMAAVAHDLFMVSEQDEAEARGAFSAAPAMVANRVSYHLDLRGPSIPVDTACSSSLTATHMAVQSLLAGECDAAVVGGAQINTRFAEWINYTQGGILSSDGKCKPFDASADGFGRAEGAVVVVLKPEEQALRDGDKIYATILGTGVNSSGSLAPVNAPVASAQEDAMRRAFKMAGVSPADVDFLELHATGTARGDPTEANWVGGAFKRDGDILVGSVKSNIGHSEITAFFASLSKVCSMFQTGLIPPTVNISVPNPAIAWDKYRLVVPVQTMRMPSKERHLVAMTSSGIGGANGHCVVQGPPAARVGTRSSFWRGEVKPHAFLVVVGGLSPRSTSAIFDAVRASLSHSTAADVARTYNRVARSMTWRSWSLAIPDQDLRFSEPVLLPKERKSLVFIYSGQGPQHLEMGRELFRTSRVFRETVLSLDAVYKNVTGKSLIADYGIFDSSLSPIALGDIWPIAITLPSITMVQIALTETLASLNIKPDYVAGHSAGETAVLYASGIGSKEMAMELSIARGQGMAPMEDKEGTMAALACTVAQANKIIAAAKLKSSGTLEIGCYNSDDSVTLSGARSAIDVAVQIASDDGMFARVLRTRCPVHSSMMELCSEHYQRLVKAVFDKYPTQAPTIPVYSSKTGRLLDEPMDAEYFWTNTKGPVRFSESMHILLASAKDVCFVELSPHPVLSSYLSSMAPPGTVVVSPLRRANPKKKEKDVEVASLFATVGQIYTTAGHSDIDLLALAGSQDGLLAKLPAYPFAPKQLPMFTPSSVVTRYRQARNGPLNYPQLRVNSQTHPSLAQHIIKGEPIMPAAGYIEMALEYGARKIWKAEFISIIALSPARPTPVEVCLEGSQWTVKSTSAADGTQWPPQYDRLHARGYLSLQLTEAECAPRPLDLAAMRQRYQPVAITDFYQGMRYFAEYGPEYRRIASVARSKDMKEALVEVRGLQADLAEHPNYRIHPAIFDAALHATAHPAFTGSFDQHLYFLPSKIATVIVHDALHENPMPDSLFVHIVLRAWTPDTRVNDCIAVNRDGNHLFSIIGLEVERHGRLSMPPVERRFTVAREITDFTIADQRLEAPVPGSSTKSMILPYEFGKEMDFYDHITSLDPQREVTIWFTVGDDKNAHAATGFSRSFRREFLVWKVHLVVFDKTWSADDHTRIVRDIISSMAVEDEIHVDAQGAISVPRIRQVDEPSSSVVLDASQPWTLRKGAVAQHSRPVVPSGHVLIHCRAVSSPHETLRSFIGEVDSSDRIVTGVVVGDLTNVFAAPKSSILDIPASVSGLADGLPVLAATSLVLALGMRVLEQSSDLHGKTVVVTHADSALGSSVIKLLEHFGLRTHAVATSAKPYELAQLSNLKADFVISGYSDACDIDMLSTLVNEDGLVWSWNDRSDGIEAVLRKRPWSIGDALRAAIPAIANQEPLLETYRVPLDIVKELSGGKLEHFVANEQQLFGADKDYILVGGIGSLGFPIALWMYENGARRICMTSRSGRASIFKRTDFAAQQALLYLESLPDLTLTLVAADAADESEMATAVKSLPGPIGGCMMLSMVLSDKLFSRHSESSYRASFPAKLGALEVLEKVLNVPSLEFLVLCSSVTALFGSAGQTNYASANSLVDGLIQKYSTNAFAITVPFVTDSTVSVDVSDNRYRHWTSFGCTSNELCLYIRDGLRMLSSGPVGLYVPDMKWDVAQHYLGRSPMFEHLVTADDSGADAKSDQASPKTFILKVLDLAADDFSPEVPLTTYGLDSLSAARLSFQLRSVVQVTQMQLLAHMTLNDIMAKISVAVEEVAAEQGEAITTGASQSASSTKMLMQTLVDRYSVRFRRREAPGVVASGKVVLITGSTGGLGCGVLVALAATPDVTRIFALNRPSSSNQHSLEERQAKALEQQALSLTKEQREKVTLVECVLHEPKLGLRDDLYQEMSRSVTHIVHNAYPLNQNLDLAAFESTCAGLENLAVFAVESELSQPPRLVFASSISAVHNFDPSVPVPELPTEDPTIAISTGYSESKWVNETILLRAAQAVPGLDISIVRIGQIAGSRNGAWDIAQWPPSVMVSGPVLGCLPMLDGLVSWTPMADVVDAMKDLAISHDVPPQVVHLDHPHPTSWAEMIKHVADEIDVPVVSYDAWLEALDKSISNDLLTPVLQQRRDHALRLRSVFHGFQHVLSRCTIKPNEAIFRMPTLGKTQMLKFSPKLNDVKPISKQDVLGWLKYWQSIDMM